MLCDFLHSIEQHYTGSGVVMIELSSLGFKKGVFSEAIVTTYNADGTANAAPMGLKLLGDQHISMSIFNTSTTCQNLEVKKCAVVNITDDIGVFYKSSIKEANPNGKPPAEWFTKAEAVEAPKLWDAEAAIEVSVAETSVDGERTSFSCKVEHLSAEPKFPQVYCRAMPLTLEAITHATRVRVFVKNPNRQEEVGKLTKAIEDCAAIVSRVAPNSQYTAVFADLLPRIKSWRAKQ